jgi:hypothetical protein
MDLSKLLSSMDLAQCLLTLATVALWVRVDKQRVDCLKESKEYLLELVSVKSELNYLKGLLQGKSHMEGVHHAETEIHHTP